MLTTNLTRLNTKEWFSKHVDYGHAILFKNSNEMSAKTNSSPLAKDDPSFTRIGGNPVLSKHAAVMSGRDYDESRGNMETLF